jgi:hypothetical protein
MLDSLLDVNCGFQGPIRIASLNSDVEQFILDESTPQHAARTFGQ